MTHDEMERTMQFILEHQAKFSAEIDRINETLAKHSQAITGLVRASGALLQVSDALLQVSRSTTDRQTAAEAQMTEIRAEMKLLVHAQRETDERLAAFITFVEKYISSRNGG